MKPFFSGGRRGLRVHRSGISRLVQPLPRDVRPSDIFVAQLRRRLLELQSRSQVHRAA